MKLTVLMENTAARADMACAHGLSFYLESLGRRILFDMGPGAQFAENAEVLGVDLDTVDFAVLSHGHYDHGGGLDVFLRRNRHAPVYLRRGAFLPHTAQDGAQIGLAPQLARAEQLKKTDALSRIDEHAVLFSDVTGAEFCSPINGVLLECGRPDRFSHEQNLLLREGDRLYLIGGCAHCGIVNILEKAIAVAGRVPDVVISGMHLSVGQSASDDFVARLAERLASYPCQFYTCHCTGLGPYEILKRRLGDRLDYLAAGRVLTL